MLVVHTLDELLQLATDPRVNGFRARPSVQLEIPELSAQAQTGAQESLNQLQARGGSLAGATFMFVTLLYGVVQVYHRNSALLSWRAIVDLLAVLIVSFGMGFTARFGALLVTRWQFARRCREQHRVLSASRTGPAFR